MDCERLNDWAAGPIILTPMNSSSSIPMYRRRTKTRAFSHHERVKRLELLRPQCRVLETDASALLSLSSEDTSSCSCSLAPPSSSASTSRSSSSFSPLTMSSLPLSSSYRRLGRLMVMGLVATSSTNFAMAQTASPDSSVTRSPIAPMTPPATPPPIPPSPNPAPTPQSISPTTPPQIGAIETPPPTTPIVPTIQSPTFNPSTPPSLSPTSSFLPTLLPSFPPTNYPTTTQLPSYIPTTTASPSVTPTTSMPTVSPTPSPSNSPLVFPSFQPSELANVVVQRDCNQVLEVEAPKVFDEVEVGIYQLQMQSYTEKLEFGVSRPFIVTTCTVTEQQLAGRRKRRGRVGDSTTMEDESGGLGGVRRERAVSASGAGENNGVLTKLYNHMDDAVYSILDTYDIVYHKIHRTFHQLTGERFLQTPTILLVMQFTIRYETRYGYDISTYPTQFQEWINTNLETVTKDMQTRFLPVVNAREVLVYNTKEPTLSPTFGSSQPAGNITTGPPNDDGGGGTPNEPTLTPGRTLDPTSSPTVSYPPTYEEGEFPPSMMPSLSPIIAVTPPPTDTKIEVNDQTSFIVGLAAGLGGAALVVFLLLLYKRKKSMDSKKLAQEAQRDREEEARRKADHEEYMRRNPDMNAPRMYKVDGPNLNSTVGLDERGNPIYQGEDKNGDRYGGNYGQGGTGHPQSLEQHGDTTTTAAAAAGGGTTSGAPSQSGTAADSIFTIVSTPSMVSGGNGSFSSNPDDPTLADNSKIKTLQDEFDKFKNQDLEFMRSGVEESVMNAESMMSLAMTRALMEEEEEIDLTWGGARDAESIEANSLCETHDWLRKNENSSVDARNEFFQEILNRMVVTVRCGMLNPSDGTRAIHSCATMLGLQVEKEHDNNVILVVGMRKADNLMEGKEYLLKAFKEFGDIESAAIAPSNRGFGFVRFNHPKSVRRALDKFRISEIEVQDVSVMIKPLKPDSTS